MFVLSLISQSFFWAASRPVCREEQHCLHFRLTCFCPTKRQARQASHSYSSLGAALPLRRLPSWQVPLADALSHLTSSSLTPDHSSSLIVSLLISIPLFLYVLKGSVVNCLAMCLYNSILALANLKRSLEDQLLHGVSGLHIRLSGGNSGILNSHLKKPTYRAYIGEKKTIPKDICTPMFTTPLFTIAKTWKLSKCPQRNG